MSRNRGQALVLTAIMVFSMVIAGVGGLPVSTAASTAGNTAVTGTLEYHDGTPVAQRKVMIKNETYFEANLTDDTGGFTLETPENADNLDLTFEQYNHTSGEDFPRDGNPDIFALRDVDTGDSTLDVGTLSLPQAYTLNVTVVNSTGHPVPGATAYINHQHNGSDAWNDAHTNSNGELVWNGSDVSQVGLELVGNIDLNVHGPDGYGDNFTQLTVTENRTLEITLRKTATVQGTITDANGDAATGDSVIIENDNVWQDNTTNAQGGYAIDVPADQTYQFHYYQDAIDQPAPDDDIPDFYTFGHFTPPSGTSQVDRQLPAANDLTVTVETESGAAVENATVNIHQQLNDDGIGTQRQTDSSGQTHIDLANGSTDVHVEPPAGLELSENGTHFTLSGDTTVTLVLHPTVNVTGTVETAGGTAPSDWGVAGHADDGPGGDFDDIASDGSFSLELAENTSHDVVFRQEDRDGEQFYPKDDVPDLEPLQNVVTGTTHADIGSHTLPIGHQFNITVLEPDGSTADGLQGHLTVIDESTARELHAGAPIHTSSNGVVTLDRAASPGIEVNGTIYVSIDAPDGADYADASQEFQVTSDGSATIQLEPAMSVNGTVLEPDGSPAAAERINVQSRTSGDTTFTDSSGQYSADVAEGHDYDVEFVQVAGLDSYEPSFERDGVPDVYNLGTVTDESDTALGTVQLPASHNLTVHVVDENGNAVSDARVNLGSRANGGSAWTRGDTNESGTFTAEVVGPLGVHVEAPTDMRTNNGTELIVDSDTTLTVVLHNATEVTGYVTNHRGETVDNRRVNLWGGPSGTSNITSQGGNFSLYAATGESYGLNFMEETDWDINDFQLNGQPDIYLFGEVTTAGETMNLGEVSLPEGHRLNVTVRNESGDPIEDAEVYVEHDIGPQEVGFESHTDATGQLVVNGHYGVEVNGTGSDDIQVHVRPPDGSEYIENGTQMAVAEDKNITITLSKGVPVGGQVQYANGENVSGWSMGLMGEGGDGQLTNKDGEFWLRVRPNSQYSLGFKQTDWGGGKTNFPKDGRPDLHSFGYVDVEDSSKYVGTKTLPQGHLVNITIENESGSTLSDIRVNVHSITEGAWFHHGGVTNSDGEVVLDGATSPGVEVNGTFHVRTEATGKYAQAEKEIEVNTTRNITVVVPPRVNVSGQFVDETDTPLVEGSTVAALNYNDSFIIRETNATGNYTLPVAGHESYSIGVIQKDPNSDGIAPRDNVTDIYAATNIDVGSKDVELGQQTVPNASGILNVRVVDETGQPVENARVTVFGKQAGEIVGVGWVTPTDNQGYYVVNNRRGIEAHGEYMIRVTRPSGNEEYVDQKYLRNVTVTGDRNVTVTIENAYPIVEGRWINPDGTPLTSTDEMGIFNFSTNYFPPDVPLNNGNFSTTVPNGTFVFLVDSLPTGDGVVDAWSVERQIQGDTYIGDIQLEKGYNVTLNATEPDGTQADTYINVWSAQKAWIYEYGTGRNLDPDLSWWAHANTRELANASHQTTLRDAWTHDTLNQTNITVDGTDRTIAFTVDQFADIDLTSVAGKTLVRDLQSPGPGQSTEELLKEGVNVRLNVLNDDQNDTVIYEALPDGYALNTTYGVQYDGSGNVDYHYNTTDNTISMVVSGDVEDIRYQVKPTGDPSQRVIFSGQYRDNGSSMSYETIGQTTIETEDARVPITGHVSYANGDDATGYTAELFGTGGDHQLSDSNGFFELMVKPNNTYPLGFKQTDFDTGGEPNFPKDGRPDLHAFKQVDVGSTGMDVGDLTLPKGHLVNVTVVNQSGATLSDIPVMFFTISDGVSAHHRGKTNANGEAVLNGATSPGIEVNGTMRVRADATGNYAQSVKIVEVNKTRDITITVRQRVNISAQFVDETGAPITNSWANGQPRSGGGWAGKITNDSGNVTIPAEANRNYTVGIIQYGDGYPDFGPRDNVTDLYSARIVNTSTQDIDIGQQVVPNASGVLDVRVVNELGEPVENAQVGVYPSHTGEQGLGWGMPTNESGYFVPGDHHGLEATGDYMIRVDPPEDSTKYVDTRYLRNVTVTDDMTVMVTLEERPERLIVNKSDSNAYDKIQAAIDNATKGDTVVITEGVYHESLEVHTGVTLLGTPGQDIGASQNAPVLDGEGTLVNAINIHENVSGVRIEGLRIKDYQKNGIRAWNRGTRNVTVKQNTIRNTSNDGVLIGGDPTIESIGTGRHHNWTIESNRVVNAGNGGLEIHNLVESVVRDNNISRESDVTGEDSWSLGITLIATNDTVEDVLIENNTVTGSYNSSGITVRAGFNGFNVSGTVSNVSIRNNSLTGAISGPGMYLWSTHGGTATNVSLRGNLVKNVANGSYAMGVIADANTTIDTVIVTANSLIGPGNDNGLGIVGQPLQNIAISKNRIANSSGIGIHVFDDSNSSEVEIHRNQIYSNSDEGVFNNGTGTLNASYNYWGASDGPSGDYVGSGDEVIGDVIVNPYYEDPAMTTTATVDERGGATANISIAATSINATQVETGETVSVDVTLENTGSADGSATVDLTVGSTVVDSQSVSVTAGGTKTVTLSHTFQSAGSYQLGATAAGDSASVGTVDVTDPEPANVSITNATLSPTNITAGERATVNVTLNNTGDVAGNITVQIFRDDTLLSEHKYEVAGNAERTVSVSRDFVETGTFEIAVENKSSGHRVVAGTLNVSDAQTTSADTPGFGVAPALVAMLAAGLVLLRRRR